MQTRNFALVLFQKNLIFSQSFVFHSNLKVFALGDTDKSKESAYFLAMLS